MPKRSIPAWLIFMMGALGVLLSIPVLWVYVSLTAKPVHPNPWEVPAVSDSPPPAEWARAVEQGRRTVRESVAGQNLPGLSLAVGVDGGIVWAEGFGFADLRTGRPVTPRHRFRIGTASTALTAAAAGLLMANGRLRLDDAIQKYVPSFPKKQWPVTLRALMGHTAGIIAEGRDGEPLFTRHCERPADALRYFAESPLLFQPGTRYLASSNGWILVSAAIEAAAQQPFLAFMQERVFDPLLMRDTVAAEDEADDGDFPFVNLVRELIFDPRAARDTSPDRAGKPDGDRVTAYFPRFRANPKYGMHVMRPLDYSCYAGASAFASTPSDLVRFGMAIHDGSKLLPRSVVGVLQTPQRLAGGEEAGYGLGWYVRTVTLAGKQTRVTGHDGDSLGGRVASLMTFPEYGIVVAVTANISFADTFALGLKLAAPFAEQGRSTARR